MAFGSRSGLVLGLGSNHTISSEEKCPLARVRVWLRVRVWFRVSFAVGGKFSSGAIVLEPPKIFSLKKEP